MTLANAFIGWRLGTDAFRDPTLATTCDYSKKFFCTRLRKYPQYSEVRRVTNWGKPVVGP